LADDPSLVVLDVRTPEEFAVSHLPGAVRVDPDRADLGSLAVAEESTVVVYCSVGYRSAAIAEALEAAGVERVYNLRGGIFAWANEGRPMIRDGAPVHRVHPYDPIWGRLLRKELRQVRVE
jgi:rhodanese-related sulfurtransferase